MGRPHRRRRAAAVLALLLLILVGTYYFINSSLFTIKDIEVRGADWETEAQVRRLTDRYIGQNIFLLNTGRLGGEIDSLPAVGRVSVERQLPGSVVVEVEQRQPVALAVGEGVYHLLDKDGYIIRSLVASATDLPYITGLSGLDRFLPGDRLDVDGIKPALQAVHYLGAVSGLISEINVGENGYLTLYTTDGLPVYLGYVTDRMPSRVESLRQILAEIEEGQIEAEYIDLSYNGRAVVKKK